MSEVVEKDSTDLIETISVESAPTIYGHNKLDAFFNRVASEVKNEAPDLSTKKGRDRIASLSAKVSRSKTAVEKPGRDYLKKIKELPKTIESELREFCQKMDSLRDEVRLPLTEWEQAEEARIHTHKSRIQSIESAAHIADQGLESIRLALTDIESVVIDELWEEFANEAAKVKDHTLSILRDALAKRQQYEAEQAELARLRAEAAAREQKEREERIAQEAEERARREAEATAQAERDAVAKREADAKAAAERRELELKLQAEKAEREKQEAINRAAQEKALSEQRQKEAEALAERQRLDAIERESAAVERARLAEIQRQADEIARQEAETKKREADKKHKGSINRAAMDAYIAGGMPEDCAKQAVTLIAKGEIPNVRISY